MESSPRPAPNKGASGSISPGTTDSRLTAVTINSASSRSAGDCMADMALGGFFVAANPTIGITCVLAMSKSALSFTAAATPHIEYREAAAYAHLPHHLLGAVVFGEPRQPHADP